MRETLVDLVAPKPNSTVLILSVNASESGALSILNDFYKQVRNIDDKSVKWVFVVSTPKYDGYENITIERLPWVKKNWGYRYFFDTIVTKILLWKYKPDLVLSLQNKGISFFRGKQMVYLHLPFILTDHRFDFNQDGKRLWLYQNVLSKIIFRSLRKVDKVIVQTHWMKDALVKKAKVAPEKIVVQHPDISVNNVGTYIDLAENRRRLFYPAIAYPYKNHITLLRAVDLVQNQGINDYELILTIRDDENNYAKKLKKYANKNSLNVRFMGQISREDVFALLAKSVLVFPSCVESFGLPLLEARRTGTYIIASDNPFSKEILQGYDKAYFFENWDYKSLGMIISQILTR